jgi:hypothetical protein
MISFAAYKKMVLTMCRQLIGGKENFRISNAFIKQCYDRGYHPSVPASAAVDAAIQAARAAVGDDDLEWIEWVLEVPGMHMPNDPADN